MAYSITPFLIFLTTIFIALSSSSSLASENNLPASTISAAPALLPDSPLSSPPALSPDITPLFPSPGGPQLSPTESSLPIIPSSPSPPNPDDNTAAALGPGVAFVPSGLLPNSSSPQLNVGGFLSSIVVSGLVAFGLLWLSG